MNFTDINCVPLHASFAVTSHLLSCAWLPAAGASLLSRPAGLNSFQTLPTYCMQYDACIRKPVYAEQPATIHLSLRWRCCCASRLQASPRLTSELADQQIVSTSTRVVAAPPAKRNFKVCLKSLSCGLPESDVYVSECSGRATSKDS